MGRALLRTLPVAGLFGLGAAGLGAAHFFMLAQSTPGRLLSTYEGCAVAGDLACLEPLSPPGQLSMVTDALGGAWHGRVEQSLERAAGAGALEAYAMHLRLDDARSEAWKAYRAIPYRERPDDRDQWISQRAQAALSEQDRALLYTDEDGDIRTLWNDVATAGIGDWRALRYSARRSIERRDGQAGFLAEAGAWELPLEQRAVLVALGAPSLSEEDAAVLATTSFEAWADRDAFVAERGARFLSQALREGFAGAGAHDIVTTRRPAGGAFFSPGVATVQAQLGGHVVHATAVQVEGAWRFSDLEFVDFDGLARELASADGLATVTRLTAAGGDA